MNTDLPNASPPTADSTRTARLLHLLGDTKVRIAIALCVLLGLALLVAAAKAGITSADLHRWSTLTLEYLRIHPFILFLALCLVPALPVPASPFLILCGVVYGPMFGPKFGTPIACAIGLLGMMINMSLVYLVAAYPARDWVERFLNKYHFKVPSLASGGAVSMICLLRLTPGFPFFIQNLVLGFLRVPFRTFLPLSFALISPFAIGFVVSGGAIFEGRGAKALIGIFVLMLAVVGTNFLRKRMMSKRAA